MANINLDQFEVVMPTINRYTTPAVIITPDGHIRVNNSFSKIIDGQYFLIRANARRTQLLLEPLTEKQELSFFLKKNGTIRAIDFTRELVQKGIKLPARYTVSWDNNIKMWCGIYFEESDNTTSVPVIRINKTRKPRTKGLSDMMAA